MEPSASPLRRESRIFVAGHRGLVGSSIVRQLVRGGFEQILLRTRDELDLLDTEAVRRFFAAERPEFVFLAAAKVGGILANQASPVGFLGENLRMQQNVIEASFQTGVRRLLFLGSSCMYPRLCPQPMREDMLLTGPLEPTNQPYAIAKIAGVEMCGAYNRQHGTRYLAAIPTNLYGPHDNFDLQTSHVTPALLRKIDDAMRAGSPWVELWGSGTPLRELLYSEDCAEACVFLMTLPNGEFDALVVDGRPPLINIGSGHEVSIRELASIVAHEIGYGGELRFDAAKPDGAPRKLLDVSRLRALGWQARTPLREGLRLTYAAYLAARSVH